MDEPSRITPPPYFQVRSEQRIDSQPGCPTWIGFESRVYEDTGLMRVRYDFLREPISAFGIGALDMIAEGVFLNIRNRTFEVALLLMKKGLSIREEELHVADLWTVDRWVIDFVQDSVGYGEPDATGRRIRSPNTLFGTRSPAWRHPRSTKSTTGAGQRDMIHRTPSGRTK